MHIEIEKDLIPYRFDIDLSDELFSFEVHHNERFDYFTVNLEKDGETLVLGEKLMLNKVMFSALTDPRLPKVYLIPIDESGEADRITFDNMGVKVFLFMGEAII